MDKFLWIDVETTGLDPIKHTIHQVAGEVVIKGVSVDTFDLKMCPMDNKVIDPDALKASSLTVEEVLARPLKAKDAYKQLNATLCKYVNKYDKADKFIFCAYNAGFDAQFINQWYADHGNKYFFGLCHGGAYFDPLQLALLYEMKVMKKVFTPDRKLVTVAKHLGVTLDKAHDALHDIAATREVAKRLWQLIIRS